MTPAGRLRMSMACALVRPVQNSEDGKMQLTQERRNAKTLEERCELVQQNPDGTTQRCTLVKGHSGKCLPSEIKIPALHSRVTGRKVA